MTNNMKKATSAVLAAVLLAIFFISSVVVQAADHDALQAAWVANGAAATSSQEKVNPMWQYSDFLKNQETMKREVIAATRQAQREVMPFIASLYVQAAEGDAPRCLGVLVHMEWVLTAAHCAIVLASNDSLVDMDIVSLSTPAIADPEVMFVTLTGAQEGLRVHNLVFVHNLVLGKGTSATIEDLFGPPNVVDLLLLHIDRPLHDREIAALPSSPVGREEVILYDLNDTMPTPTPQRSSGRADRNSCFSRPGIPKESSFCVRAERLGFDPVVSFTPGGSGPALRLRNSVFEVLGIRSVVMSSDSSPGGRGAPAATVYAEVFPWSSHISSFFAGFNAAYVPQKKIWRKGKSIWNKVIRWMGSGSENPETATGT